MPSLLDWPINPSEPATALTGANEKAGIADVVVLLELWLLELLGAPIRTVDAGGMYIVVWVDVVDRVVVDVRLERVEDEATSAGTLGTDGSVGGVDGEAAAWSCA